MELSFTPEQNAWREEVRDFLDKELPVEWQKSTEFCEDDDFWEFAIAFTRKVSAKGWIGLTWPKEYGGLGRPTIDQLIYSEEMTYRDAPIVNTIGWGLAAGALLSSGSHEQKLKHLPGIAATDQLWAEGYTEPGAGSDLASLTTSAVRDGDEWVVNGQKTFTTWGSHADVMYLAARTDPDVPRHRGISIFKFDLKQPGVSFGPLFNLGGGRQNHTYIDNARVPHDNLIGTEGRAWDMIMGSFYGGNIGAAYMDMQSRLDRVVAYCKTTRRGGRLLIDDAVGARPAGRDGDHHPVAAHAHLRVAVEHAGQAPTGLRRGDQCGRAEGGDAALRRADQPGRRPARAARARLEVDPDGR